MSCAVAAALAVASLVAGFMGMGVIVVQVLMCSAIAALVAAGGVR